MTKPKRKRKRKPIEDSTQALNLKTNEIQEYDPTDPDPQVKVGRIVTDADEDGASMTFFFPEEQDAHDAN